MNRPVREKRKGKHRGIWKAILAVLVLAVIGGGIVLTARPDLGFMLTQGIRQMMASNPPREIKAGELDLSAVDLEELDRRGRCEMSQSLLLINESYPVPGEEKPQVGEYKDSGVYMNLCMEEAYANLAEAAEEQFGEKLLVKSAFRSAEDQQEEYEADSETAAQVGCSEHQMGLSLDVYVKNFAGRSFLKTKTGRFVNSEGYRYGFIIRYPVGKKGVTGIGYEPWHIRYVGEPHAEIMYKNNWTLEEYYEFLEVGKYYKYNGWLITRQPKGEVRLPNSYTEMEASPDNQGNYVITMR